MPVPQPVRPARRRPVGQRKRAWIARALFALAVIIAATHVLEHLGVFQVMSPGWEDLLVGYPAAGVLAILAAAALGR